MKAEHDVDSVEKVWRLAQSVKVAMLTLHDGEGLTARPMYSLIPDDWEAVWFVTDRNSPKVSEAAQRIDALLTYSTGENGEHLVMSGILTIVADRDKLRGLWSPGADLYFPKGPDDPAAILLRFEPYLAEYWKHGGGGAINFVFEYARAKLTGNRTRLGDHGRVAL
jgi:general stress protein 26